MNIEQPVDYQARQMADLMNGQAEAMGYLKAALDDIRHIAGKKDLHARAKLDRINKILEQVPA